MKRGVSQRLHPKVRFHLAAGAEASACLFSRDHKRLSSPACVFNRERSILPRPPNSSFLRRRPLWRRQTTPVLFHCVVLKYLKSRTCENLPARADFGQEDTTPFLYENYISKYIFFGKTAKENDNELKIFCLSWTTAHLINLFFLIYSIFKRHGVFSF